MSSVLLWVIAILAVVIPLLAVALSAVPYLRAPSGKRVGPTTPAGPAAPALNVNWSWVGYPALAIVTVAAIVAATYYGWSYIASAVKGLGVDIPSWMPDINWWKILLVVAAIAAIIVAFYLLRALWQWWRTPATRGTTPAPARTAWFPWKTVLALGILVALIFLPPWSEWMSKVQLTADSATSVPATCDGKARTVTLTKKAEPIVKIPCRVAAEAHYGKVTVIGSKPGERETFTGPMKWNFDAKHWWCEDGDRCVVEVALCPSEMRWNDEAKKCGVRVMGIDIQVRPTPRS